MNLTPFSFNGADVRVITDGQGEPWFVAMDVASTLGYANTSDAVARHCKAVQILKSQGATFEVPNRGLQIIPERDLYRLIMGSQLETAQEFEEWVVGEVLPSIRKTGTYQLKPPAELSRLELLEIALATERENLRVTAERDEAIRTKAEIGTRREATAMATASAAVRQVQRLKDELGLGTRQAAVLAVEKATGRKFGVSGYVPLRRWCKARGITAPQVFHPTFGSVRCWPAGAWLEVYRIDLAALFGADGEHA
jgi:prophage antirepressor-like protein